jgi:hypothetical protein
MIIIQVQLCFGNYATFLGSIKPFADESCVEDR